MRWRGCASSWPAARPCLHRRAPLVLLALATAAMVVYTLREYPGGPVYVTTLVGMFAVAADRGPGRAWLPAAVATGLLTGAARSAAMTRATTG